MIYKIYEIGVCAVNLRIGGAMHILEYENYEETKKHYDTDFSYNTYPCSIPLDFPCVPMHWHRETEIIYVKSGRGMVNVDGISYPVVKDSIVFILPGRLHSIAQYESEAFSYENIIFDMIYNKFRKKTMLIIAHRLATVKNCDKIIVMDKGKIIEQGTHKELLEKKGQYYRLWEMQQGNFVIREDEIKEKQCEDLVESDDKGVMSYT